ncbi:MAG: ribosome small subunit-dependent GTPase A [Selenomonadaceae bacterium]|nr:ribosome small subunit-dependent GTPase A [Selenomonadaceae bacterium]MBR6711039.1 ribosome small subunit-dependent GTPase A [Selenomonadaceae bacterium]
METGRVLKFYNSFFYVQTDTELLTCRLRGKLKRDRRGVSAVCPGDLVELTKLADGTGVLERPLARRNLLRRPAVANIDQVILTFAAAEPDLHPLLLNRFLVLAEWSGVPSVVICVNKMDLAAEQDVLSCYENYYPVLRVSAERGEGMELLRERLAGKVTVFAGPSGVGKSSVLNALHAGLSLATGAVSEKIRRGRHTTRVAELLPFAGGFLVDTPGFSSMELADIDPAELSACFPDFQPYLGHCRFSPCTHSHEPDCAVKAALEAGEILRERYDAYCAILDEIKTKAVR